MANVKNNEQDARFECQHHWLRNRELIHIQQQAFTFGRGTESGNERFARDNLRYYTNRTE
jgi:hypothetical protein